MADTILELAKTFAPGLEQTYKKHYVGFKSGNRPFNFAVGKPTTQERSRRAVSSRALRFLRDKKVVETTADDFLAVINTGGVSASHFLRRFHILALGLGWLPWPVLQKAMWPKPKPTYLRIAI